MSRHKREFKDEIYDKVEELALKGLKNMSISTHLNIPENTFTRHFAALCSKKRVERKLKILEWQMKRAEAGDTTMLIWLGKNELEQTDKQNIEHSGGLTVEVVNYAIKNPT
jgi:hypothetical protein